MYSLDAPGHHLPNKQEMNAVIKEDIYRQYIRISWITTPGGLRPKMTFYAQHFLQFRDNLIVWPQLCFNIECIGSGSGQLKVGSHLLWSEVKHQILQKNKV